MHSLPAKSPPAKDFVRILEEDGRSHVGVVLERIPLEPQTRILLEFGIHEAPLFAIGESVSVFFTGSDTDKGEMRAQVLFRSESERVRRYEFLVSRAPVYEGDDRRRYERQRAETDVFATLRSRGSDTEVTVNVRDLSLDGIALDGELWVDRALVGSDQVEITVDLEDGQKPVTLDGRLAYRRLVDQRVHYGVAFRTSAARGIANIARLDRFLGGEGLRQAS